MVTVIIMVGILGVLVVAVAAFYVHSRTPEWGDSELRIAMVRLLVVLGPLFGMRYREPHRELPVATSPGRDPDPAGVRLSSEDEGVGPDAGA